MNVFLSKDNNWGLFVILTSGKREGIFNKQSFDKVSWNKPGAGEKIDLKDTIHSDIISGIRQVQSGLLGIKFPVTGKAEILMAKRKNATNAPEDSVPILLRLGGMRKDI